VGKNRYSKALKILKSNDIDKKLSSVQEDVPTNSTRGVYTKSPLDVDADQLELLYSDKYWSGGDRFDGVRTGDFSQDFLNEDPSGKDTSRMIGEDGTVFTHLPPSSEHFILGPIVDGFVSNESGTYTNIGYIQKDTRQFVLLAKIEGQWKEGMNGSYSVWNGTSEGLTIYNKNFTLEMAQWIKERFDNGNYVNDVPYFYNNSGVRDLKNINLKLNMKVGNVVGVEIDPENPPSVFTPEERERIDTHMSQFMTFKVSDEIRNDELGKLMSGMSLPQIKEVIRNFNNRTGK
jgi:hypothetical protein